MSADLQDVSGRIGGLWIIHTEGAALEKQRRCPITSKSQRYVRRNHVEISGFSRRALT
jgi:hypothetical protein